MKTKSVHRWILLIGLFGFVIAIFAGRAILVSQGQDLPRTFQIFDTATLIFSILMVGFEYRRIKRSDLLLSLIVGGGIGALLPFSSLFSPYLPLFGATRPLALAAVRSFSLAITMLAGLLVLRQGGPVQLRLADGLWKKGLTSLGFGALIGLPLAGINLFALSMTQKQPFSWQNPLAAAVDALQPAVVEEVFYRFAFLGLIWLLLRRSWPEKAPWLAAMLGWTVHNFSHLDDLFIQNPLFGLGYGLVLGLLWGLPEVILALRRDLESAVGFHWIQDALRFFGGF